MKINIGFSNNDKAVFLGDTTFDIVTEFSKNPKNLSQNICSLKRSYLSYGGKAANAARHCAKQKVKTFYIGTVGSDFENFGYREYLEKQNVSTEHVFKRLNPTPIFISGKYENERFVFYPKAEPDEQEPNLIKNHYLQKLRKINDAVIYAAFFDFRIINEIFRFAKTKNNITALNPLFILKKQTENLNFSNIDLLFINEIEEKQLIDIYGTPNKISNKYNIFIIVTKGSKNIDIYFKNSILSCSVPQLNNINDSTGAGDAFAGTTIGSIINNNGIVEIPSSINLAVCEAQKLLIKKNYD